MSDENCIASDIYRMDDPEPRCGTHRRSPWACLQVRIAEMAMVKAENERLRSLLKSLSVATRMEGGVE